MGKAWRLVALGGLLLLPLTPAGAASVPNLAGRWLPVPALSTPWPDPLPLTPAGRAQLAAFEPDRDEPAGFCMPLGTPRNTLAGASALEVLQTDDRVYFIFQPNLLNAETRRVYLDGRPLPDEAQVPPTWLGSSRGHWDAAGALVVKTVAVEPQALLDGKGLGHSAGLVVHERWHLARDRHRGRLLVDELTLEDPERFTAAVHLTRAFAWAPNAPLSEGQCAERLWIDGLWRSRLAEHAAARAAAPPSTAAPPRGDAAGAKP